MESAGRILAIDYGSRRMGLAVTDPLGITAQGIETLQRKNKRSDFARLERLLREYQVREIVLGYPLRMSGEEGRQTEKVDAFRAELQARFNLPDLLDTNFSQPFHRSISDFWVELLAVGLAAWTVCAVLGVNNSYVFLLNGLD